jgi:hypothetical protein
MAIELWEPNDLYELRTDPRMDALPSFILDTFYTATHFAEDKKIRFADLPEADRFMAPFSMPYEQGKPIDWTQGESLESFLPPYIKLLNAVRPEDAKNVKPSEMFRNRGQRPTLEQRFDMRVQELVAKHLRAIKLREIWMAARGFIDGQVLIEYERDQGAANPSVLLNFGRDPGHTVTKTSDYWNDPDSDILGDIEAWSNTMYLARRGGTPAQVIVGAKVAPVFRYNKGVKDMLDTNYRGGEDVVINRGIMNIERPLTRIGQLKTGLEILTYKDTIDIPNGAGKTKVDLMNEKDVLLVAPGASGVRAYGAIYDVDAVENGLSDVDIFQKMYKEDNPGARFILSQSSPLPIPLYPNRTFKARVLA